MEDQSVLHSTFVVERSYPCSPERVFAAFADPVKKRRWFVDREGNEVEHFELDFRVGGKENTCIRYLNDSPIKGMTITNDTIFQNIVPNRRIVFASSMMLGENCISATLVTVELLPSESGTDLVFTHQGAFFEGSGGPAMREAGWHTLLERLAQELLR
ncbi:MAG: SRPBCC family protein [Bryobacteraceae bacterium]